MNGGVAAAGRCCKGPREAWEKNGGGWVEVGSQGYRDGKEMGDLWVMAELNGRPLGDLGR